VAGLLHQPDLQPSVGWADLPSPHRIQPLDNHHAGVQNYHRTVQNGLSVLKLLNKHVVKNVPYLPRLSLKKCASDLLKKNSYIFFFF
jgi:hypothetical protein